MIINTVGELNFPELSEQKIPTPRITCRLCGMTAEGNSGAILLCPFCLEDLDKSRAHLDTRRDAVFARLDRAEQAWKAVREETPQIAAWWDQVADKVSLQEKALSIGGRGARVVRAYRAFCAEFDACAVELERIREGQREVNMAMLSAVGVV